MRGTGVLAASSTIAVLAGLAIAHPVGAAVAGPAAAHPAQSWAGRVQAAATTGAFLEGVSCRPATSACTAVGFRISSNGAPSTLAERWDGTAWVSQPTPTPEHNGRQGAELDGVACTSRTACQAVGSSFGTGGHRLFGAGWNGTRWASQAYATPAPVAGPSGVACAWRKDCMAVGGRTNLGTLAEHWNGTRWSARPTPRRGVLVSVSCPASNSCTAVGFSASQNHLAEHWNGTKWSAQVSPSIPEYTSLDGVSCVSTSNCMAVGWQGSEDVTGPLVEHWTGGRWTVPTVPDPDPGGAAELNSVSCTSASNCMAVGDDQAGPGGSDVTLAAQWNGTAWALLPTPSPDTYSALYSVSCTGPAACVAVGAGSATAGGTVTPVTEFWDGTAWTVQPAAG
jgi:hypothetical protein